MSQMPYRGMPQQQMSPQQMSQQMPQWRPTANNPYPMNFMQAPSPQHQLAANYGGRPQLQGLSVNQGPQMYPQMQMHPQMQQSPQSACAYHQSEFPTHQAGPYAPHESYKRPPSGPWPPGQFTRSNMNGYGNPAYPMTHSVPGPQIQSYINPGKQYGY